MAALTLERLERLISRSPDIVVATGGDGKVIYYNDGAIGVAAIYGNDDRVMGGGIIGWALALLAGYILRKAVAKVLPNLLPDLSSTIHSLIGLGVLVLGAFLFNLLLFGGERTAKPWVWVAIVAVLGLGLAVVGQHAELRPTAR